MENMEIKNRNVFLNLNSDEKIICIPQKDKSNFYWNFILIIIFGLPVFTLLSIISLLKPDIFGATWEHFIFPVLLPVFYYGTYKIIVDYFFTDVILTNQRFIISRFNKIRSIYNGQIERITGRYGNNGGAISTTIKLTNKKSYRLLFIDKNTIRNKFKEIRPDYDDSKAVAKERKQGVITLVILLLLLPFFLYAEYKLKLNNNQSRSYRASKHQHNAKEPYFDLYMTNLQDKMKSHWDPPKGEKSSNVVLLFKVDRNGNVLKNRILKSSNNTAIDNSALEALKKSEPLEPLPKEFKGKNIDIQFNFDYNVLSNKPKI